jgi:hypothetical protein
MDFSGDDMKNYYAYIARRHNTYQTTGNAANLNNAQQIGNFVSALALLLAQEIQTSAKSKMTTVLNCEWDITFRF